MENEQKADKKVTTLKDKVINTCEVLWSLSILVFLLIFCVFTPLTHCVNDIVVCITAITIIVWARNDCHISAIRRRIPRRGRSLLLILQPLHQANKPLTRLVFTDWWHVGGLRCV